MTTFTTDNGETYVVNPTPTEQITYQEKGLAADARDPADYLRLVARTFSSFKDRVSNANTTSYINGFEITYETSTLTELVSGVPTLIPYHTFKINAGAAFINNQFVEFQKNTMFQMPFSDLVYPASISEFKDYAIIVTYGYIDQYNDSDARIRIVAYDDLTFPLKDVGDLSVCSFKDTSLDGAATSVIYNFPGILLAKFSLQGYDGRLCTTYKENGARKYNQIDDQNLGNLYISNYKLLFKYFGEQASAAFSTAGLTQSTFINIDPKYLDQTVKSGDFVRIYQDPDTKAISYKPALASRQKFDQVVGLYLKNISSGHHLIYMNGLVTIDSTFLLEPTHPLNFNLIPGLHYYLENSVSIYDTTMPIVKVGDLSLADNSGRITTKYYNGGVMVGTATACNQLLININHSMEIGVQNLLELFGDTDTFNREIKAQKLHQDAKSDIVENNKNIDSFNSKITSYNGYIGSILTTSQLVKVDKSTLFPTTDSWEITKNKVEEVYKYVYKAFNNSDGGFEGLKKVELFSNAPTASAFSNPDYNDLRTLLCGAKYTYSGTLYKMKKILTELQTKISDVQISISNNSVQTYTSTDFSSYWSNKILSKRLNLNDNPDIIDNFEDYMVQTNEVVNYTSDITTTNNKVDELKATINTTNIKIKAFKSSYQLFQSYYNNINSLLEIIDSWITMYQGLITKYQTNINIYNSTNLVLNKTISDAEKNIVTLPPLALDIFHMDEFQRKVFNYTYISDRLKRALYYVDIIQIEFDKISSDYTAIYNNTNPDSGITANDKILVAKKLENVTNKKAKNLALIEEYKIEFNKLRISFGLAAFTKEQFVYDLDPGEMVDERLGQYKFGQDDHTACTNGLCENWLDECKGIIYDEFAIVANQTDINLGKVINVNVVKNTTIDLFRITDNNAINETTGKMIVPSILLTDEITGSIIPNTNFKIILEELPRDKYIVGTYPGYQVKLKTYNPAIGESLYNLNIDTTKHVNNIRLKIGVVNG